MLRKETSVYKSCMNILFSKSERAIFNLVSKEIQEFVGFTLLYDQSRNLALLSQLTAFPCTNGKENSFHDIKNYRYVITLFCCAFRNIFGILIAVRSKELECNSRLIFPASLKNIIDITLNYLSPSTHSFVKFLQLDS